MIYKEKWESLSQWLERLPWWQAIVVVPLATPLLAVVAAACFRPKSTAFGVLTLLAIYCYALFSGLQTLPDVLWSIGFVYAFFMLGGFEGVVEGKFKTTKQDAANPDDPKATERP